MTEMINVIYYYHKYHSKKRKITQTPTLFFKANRKHKVLFDLKRKHALISLPEFVPNKCQKNGLQCCVSAVKCTAINRKKIFECFMKAAEMT